jgi:catechol 2,3-dioxygenase-like lactoylglutathione lyase family enzyme
MPEIGKIKVLFVAGFGPIISDAPGARRLYQDALHLPFEEQGDYLHTDKLDGVKHFALWPLAQAAQSCFGKDEWPDDLPVPQAWLEFDVEDVEEATRELEAQGYRLLVAGRKEPWGQTVTRFLGPEGLLLGITFTPWMRK